MHRLKQEFQGRGGKIQECLDRYTRTTYKVTNKVATIEKWSIKIYKRKNLDGYDTIGYCICKWSEKAAPYALNNIIIGKPVAVNLILNDVEKNKHNIVAMVKMIKWFGYEKNTAIMELKLEDITMVNPQTLISAYSTGM